MITIDHMNFELMENYRDAFDEEQFMGKYSEVLNKYDYIVGDIGYEKLRLAGFFRDNKKQVERDKKYSAIEDYLSEYCNFGCAYFVLRKVTRAELKEKERIADDRDEGNKEEIAAGAEAGPADNNEDAVKPGKADDSRQKKSYQKRKKGKGNHEARDTKAKNKTFASFKQSRQQ